MAERGYGLIGFRKVADDFEDFRFRAQIFGGAASGDYEGVVIFGTNFRESGVQREIVAGLFGVGLIAFEIMNGGAHELAGFFVGTSGVNGMAEDLESLERNHYLVVFDVIPDKH
jgi:hypothetical protein